MVRREGSFIEAFGFPIVEQAISPKPLRRQRGEAASGPSPGGFIPDLPFVRSSSSTDQRTVGVIDDALQRIGGELPVSQRGSFLGTSEQIGDRRGQLNDRPSGRPTV